MYGGEDGSGAVYSGRHQLEAHWQEEVSDRAPQATIATVCKIFDFPAAHSNHHYQGSDARLHGHTWTLEVYAQGRLNGDPSRRQFGMVVDFASIKEAYRRMIEPAVEHQNLDETLGHLPERTTELIAAWILERLHVALPEVFKVRLWEGKTSFVEVEL